MTRIAPLPISSPRKTPDKPKCKPKLKRQGAARNVKKHVGHGRRISPSDAHVGRPTNPTMSKIQKESKLKSKVGTKLTEAAENTGQKSN